MPLTVSVNGLTLCHRLSGGVSAATTPDVCRTPGRGEVPYPNVAYARDLAKGTTTVMADGADMCANYGSEFSTSTGDEPGTDGGVTSGVNTKEATWITYSFDVKLEGRGACRLTDKMFHNRRNAVNMGGLTQDALDPNEPEDICARLAREIEELVNRDKHLTGDGGRHGLRHRFREQFTGANGPPGSGVGDPSVWDRHDRVIREQQSGLRDRLNDYDTNHCGGGGGYPIPIDAWVWATRPAPTPQEWVGPEDAAPLEADTSLMDEISTITGLTGTALVIYLLLSEGSRVLFPPRNLIPIP